MPGPFLRVEYHDKRSDQRRALVFVDVRGNAEWGRPLESAELRELGGYVAHDRLTFLLLSEISSLRERVAALEGKTYTQGGGFPSAPGAPSA